MKNRYRFLRKSYAMDRMARAIERAIEATTIKEKDHAARWAAAWGMLCGIKTRPVNVQRSELIQLGIGEISNQPGTVPDIWETHFSQDDASLRKSSQQPLGTEASSNG